ncbi:lymphocyte antigen 6D-like [Protopterus annectens]|uniref:lymphocyte antigen 6D-like n=1 Tax=Protopterus annectens TaxID=7888 RepID=UPI001CFB9C3C|nr:lymphocyte antigen 6D-like [Protopterus annectens]
MKQTFHIITLLAVVFCVETLRCKFCTNPYNLATIQTCSTNETECVKITRTFPYRVSQRCIKSSDCRSLESLSVPLQLIVQCCSTNLCN